MVSLEEKSILGRGKNTRTLLYSDGEAIRDRRLQRPLKNKQNVPREVSEKPLKGIRMNHSFLFPALGEIPHHRHWPSQKLHFTAAAIQQA